jgi:hypothetical protein
MSRDTDVENERGSPGKKRVMFGEPGEPKSPLIGQGQGKD